MHVIGAKAEAFYEALQPSFKTYIKNVVDNAKTLAETLSKNGIRVISGGTDNHLLLIDVKSTFGITGKLAEEVLDKINITVNKNTIPNETESPFKTSGLRLGTAAMTTRGLNKEDFIKIGNIIYKSLSNINNENIQKELKKEVLEITNKYPIK